MLNIVIFGAPGSGKGTQSELLIERYGLKHISTGEILRNEMRKGTELGRLAFSYISEGHLVPDNVMIEILEELIESHTDVKGFVFDGFPRTLKQGEALTKMLTAHGKQISDVVSLEVPDHILEKRLIQRGKMQGRADDNRNAIERRLKDYHRLTSQLKTYYGEQDVLKEVQGTGSIEEIFKAIVAAIEGKK